MFVRRARKVEHRERPPEDLAVGALVFFHGFSGAPEDFLPLIDEFDPHRRLHVFLPRGPWRIRGGRRSWFNPDPTKESMNDLDPVRRWLDILPYSRPYCVFAGWSEGARVAYTVGLESATPPAAIVACGGLLPEVGDRDWVRPLPPVLIAHGSNDKAVPVENARRACALLAAAGAPVSYVETPTGHLIDRNAVPLVREFLRTTLPGRSVAD